MTAPSPTPAGSEPGISECSASCGADQDGGHWHSLGGYVWAQFPRRQARPAAPDTTGGELREEIARAMTELTDWRGGPDGDYWLMRADRVLALPALRDLLAERDTLAAQVQAVEGLAATWEADAKRHDDAEPINSDGLTRMILAARFLRMNASNLRRALGTPTTGGGE